MPPTGTRPLLLCSVQAPYLDGSISLDGTTIPPARPQRSEYRFVCLTLIASVGAFGSVIFVASASKLYMDGPFTPHGAYLLVLTASVD